MPKKTEAQTPQQIIDQRLKKGNEWLPALYEIRELISSLNLGQLGTVLPSFLLKPRFDKIRQ